MQTFSLEPRHTSSNLNSGEGKVKDFPLLFHHFPTIINKFALTPLRKPTQRKKSSRLQFTQWQLTRSSQISKSVRVFESNSLFIFQFAFKPLLLQCSQSPLFSFRDSFAFSLFMPFNFHCIFTRSFAGGVSKQDEKKDENVKSDEKSFQVFLSFFSEKRRRRR